MDWPSLYDAGAQAASSQQGSQQPWLCQLFEVRAGVATTNADQSHITDLKRDSDKFVETHATGDDITAQSPRLNTQVFGNLCLNQGHLLVRPPWIAPVAEPTGIAVADDARAGHGFNPGPTLHRCPSAGRREQADNLTYQPLHCTTICHASEYGATRRARQTRVPQGRTEEMW